MSTQATTWPKGLYQSERPAVSSEAVQGASTNRELTFESARDNASGLFFVGVFAAELVAIAAGVGIILASLAALVAQTLLR